MNAKEKWPIAWSIYRVMHNTKNWHPYKEHETALFKPRTPKRTKPLLILAKKCHKTREEEDIEVYYKKRLEIHLKDKGFQKEWTGWKYTWVKFEEKDVPF